MKLRQLGLIAISILFGFTLVGCDLLDEPANTITSTEVKKPNKPNEESKPKKDIYTHDEYLMARKNEEIKIEGYIQAKHNYKLDSTTNLYVQDDNGGYYVYGLRCTKEQYDNDLVIGQKVRIDGYKDIWHGLHEVSCSLGNKYTKLEGNKVYDALSLNYINNETLKNLAATKVKLTDLTVIDVAKSEDEHTDLYYQVTDGKNILTFCVETDLLPICSEEYKNALTMKVGDVIDAEGMMYVYDNAQLHTTRIVKKGLNVLAKGESSMTYAEYMASEVNSEVIIEAFIQEKQAHIEGHTSLYLADQDGAYFVYNLECSSNDYDEKLKIGNKIRIKGIRGQWGGMDEILGGAEGAKATFEILPGRFRIPLRDLTDHFNDDDLTKYVGQHVRFRNLVVNGAPVVDGDIYLDVRMDSRGEGKIRTFCVESYLRNQSTKVYKMVENLKQKDKISLEGYLFIYNNQPQLHITECIKASR